MLTAEWTCLWTRGSGRALLKLRWCHAQGCDVSVSSRENAYVSTLTKLHGDRVGVWVVGGRKPVLGGWQANDVVIVPN